MKPVQYGGGIISVANEINHTRYNKVKLDTLPVLELGQVCFVNGTSLVLADENTDSTKICYLADRKWSTIPIENGIGKLQYGEGSYELLSTRPEKNDLFCYKITDTADFVVESSVIGLECGLDSTGTKVDTTNTTAKLIKIESVTDAVHYQKILFRFL